MHNPAYCFPFPSDLHVISSLPRSLLGGLGLFGEGRDGLGWHRLVLGGQRQDLDKEGPHPVKGLQADERFYHLDSVQVKKIVLFLTVGVFMSLPWLLCQ